MRINASNSKCTCSVQLWYRDKKKKKKCSVLKSKIHCALEQKSSLFPEHAARVSLRVLAIELLANPYGQFFSSTSGLFCLEDQKSN